MLDVGIWEKLTGDANVTAKVATYGPEVSPAIFTVNPVPPDAQRPWIFINVTSEIDEPDKLNVRREGEADVFIVSDASGSKADHRALIQAVRDSLMGATLTVYGVSSYKSQVAGPSYHPGDKTVYADLIRVQAQWKE